MNTIEKIDGYLEKKMNEEKMFMHLRKQKKGLKDLEQKLVQAKANKNPKLASKLEKEITKRKKSIEGSSDFHKKGQK